MQKINTQPYRQKQNKPFKKSSYFLTKAVVVTHEWIECTQLHPPSTQLLCSLPSKPTDVSTYQGNPKQLEVQHS